MSIDCRTMVAHHLNNPEVWEAAHTKSAKTHCTDLIWACIRWTQRKETYFIIR